MVRVNDEKELAKRYDQVHIDTKSSQVSKHFWGENQDIFLSNFVYIKSNFLKSSVVSGFIRDTQV